MTVNVSKPALNVREKLAELDKPTGIAGEAMLRAETPQEQFNLIGAGRRNIFINGDFQVSQRGNYSSATSVGNANYYIDRWKIDAASTVNPQIVHSDVTLPNNQETKSLKITATTGNGNAWMGFIQTVEDYKKLSNQTVTMSGWVKTNNPYAAFRHTNDQNLGDSFIPDGQWHYYSRTIKLGSVTGASNQGGASWGVVMYDVGAVNISANDYIEMAQVQLELGKVATPFEHRSYGEELALCQRYFYRLTGSNAPYSITGVVGASDHIFTFWHPQPMRTAPTTQNRTGTWSSYHVPTVGAGQAGPTATNLSSMTFEPYTYGGRFYFTKQGTSGLICWVDIAGNSGTVDFSAEL